MQNKYTLPKEFGQKWVEALRSTPESKHGQNAYYNPETGCYCATGLAVKVLGIDKIRRLHFIEPTGFVAPDGFYQMKHEVIKLNDDSGYTFREIADWIELNCEFV